MSSRYSLLTDRQKWAFAWLPHSNIVADIGCSISPLLEVISDKARIVYAVDADKNALLQVARNFPHIHVIESSVTELSLPSDSCDAVLFLDVLEHVENDRQAINELWRVLRRGGVLIMSVPHKGLFRFLDPQNLSAKLRGTFSSRTEHRHYAEQELRLLMEPKFTLLRKHFGGLILYPLTFAANNYFRKHLGIDWGWLFRKLGDWENDLSWGRFSYNIVLMARKNR